MRVRSLVGFLYKYPVTSTEKSGKWPGQLFSAAEGALAFYVWLPRSPAPALKVTWDLDKEDSCDGRSDNDLGTGLTGCNGGIDERPREGGFFC
jgi:hypothetical protein